MCNSAHLLAFKVLITLTHVILVQTPLEQLSHVFHRDAEWLVQVLRWCSKNTAGDWDQQEDFFCCIFLCMLWLSFSFCLHDKAEALQCTFHFHRKLYLHKCSCIWIWNVASWWWCTEFVTCVNLCNKKSICVSFARDLWSFSENVFKGFRKTFNCLKYRRREANMLQQFDTHWYFSTDFKYPLIWRQNRSAISVPTSVHPQMISRSHKSIFYAQ